MKKWLFLVLGLITPVLALSEEGNIEITSPKSGWRDSSNKKVGFSQTVHYPDVRVNEIENQPDTGKIEGIIRGDVANNKKPYTLVVNGNAMPIDLDGNKFSRPYSFAKGSNSVEILSPSRKKSAQAQFYDVSEQNSSVRIRIILSWDSPGTDIDLHLLTPDAKHCYYGQRTLEDGTALDVDVTTGFGPEIIASPGTVKGPYMVFVNYYGRSSSQIITVANVTVITDEGTLDEKVQMIRIPLRREGDLTHAFTFNY